jgi:hypothetical protein
MQMSNDVRYSAMNQYPATATTEKLLLHLNMLANIVFTL